MTIRCKFRCEKTETYAGYGKDENGQPKQLYNAVLVAVSDGSEENKRFWQYTPSGRLEVGSVNVLPWKVGGEYYIDIVPAEEG